MPILLSIPHSGTAIPEEIRSRLVPEKAGRPDDTDWFVDRLYDFAPELGITIIMANYSRWVIDLNRTPDGKPLYDDGRVITELCPTVDFTGAPLYTGKLPSDQEIKDRKSKYYMPYHQKIAEELALLKVKFGKVLLWDCHSIRQTVPTIRKEPFPDLILGSADGLSTEKGLIDTVITALGQSDYSLHHNHPFKGGYITRNYGHPDEGFHALQLEMTKINYMDDSELEYDEDRANDVRTLFRNTFLKLIDYLA